MLQDSWTLDSQGMTRVVTDAVAGGVMGHFPGFLNRCLMRNRRGFLGFTWREYFYDNGWCHHQQTTSFPIHHDDKLYRRMRMQINSVGRRAVIQLQKWKSEIQSDYNIENNFSFPLQGNNKYIAQMGLRNVAQQKNSLYSTLEILVDHTISLPRLIRNWIGKQLGRGAADNWFIHHARLIANSFYSYSWIQRYISARVWHLAPVREHTAGIY